MVPIHHRSIASLQTAMAAKSLDTQAVLQHYRARIDKYNPVLNCYLHVNNAPVFGNGALAGAAIAIKNNIDVAGFPTTAGIGARRQALAQRDAPVVQTLKSTGAAILGTLNMHEAALGATTDNKAYGRCENPHRIGYTPGGSSGGSASAVAAGLCAAALGTDTLGSIRIPASFCGIYGLKPTNGAISNVGTVPMAHRFDCIGPMARSLKDLRALWSVMAPLSPASAITSIARLDVVEDHRMDDAVRSAYELACSLSTGLGVPVQAAHVDQFDFAKALQAALVITECDALAFHAADLARDSDGFTPELKSFLDFASKMTEATILAATTLLDDLAMRLNSLLQLHDAILMPTTPCVPFAFGTDMPNDIAHFTMLANIAGLPAIALPGGWTTDGLPIGIQLVGRPGAEQALIDFAIQLDATARAYRFPSAFEE
jgi:aspartyl-tRNA(Asn)/glutamyl-tRNA(Gln) amidotransferase subunit A